MRKQEKFSFSVLCTFVWGLLVHGYCYFNLLYSHDSLLVNQHDTRMQLTIGRFMHLLYWKLRGNYYPPALVGMLSLLFLGIAVYFIVLLFGMDQKPEILLTAGILTTNISISMVNATYIHEIDIYMLAMLCAVSAVYLCRNLRLGCIPGAVLICLSLGMYQAFFEVAIVLLMMLAILDILRKEKLSKVLKDGFLAIGMLLVGLIVYLILMKLSLALTGTDSSDHYNSPTRALEISSMGQLAGNLIKIYTYVIKTIFVPDYAISALHTLAVVPCMAVVAGCLILLIRHRHIGRWDLTILLVLIALLPFGMNLLSFTANGKVHELMVYAVFLTFVFGLVLLKEVLASDLMLSWKEISRKILTYSVPVLLSILIFENAVFANQAYLKKDLEFRNNEQIMNRVIDRMEQTEGFVVGETPVHLVGSMLANPLTHDREGLTSNVVAVKFSTPITYHDTLEWYYHYILAYPNPYLPDVEELNIDNEIHKMPVFPAPGSCQIIDGVMVVRLSE